MKKTLTVNISGSVFHIDEDAYVRLRDYLARLELHFKNDPGCTDILSGIEERMADIFRGKREHERQVVSLDDVKEAINQLGEPAEISGNDEGASRSKTSGFNTMDEESPPPKRLFRDPDNKYIGGVCGGLGTYFNVDPVWMRIIFLLMLFSGGFGLLLYIILWIIIPKARSAADRLSMRGERVNISNIEKTIREDLKDIKRNIENLSRDRHDKK